MLLRFVYIMIVKQLPECIETKGFQLNFLIESPIQLKFKGSVRDNFSATNILSEIFQHLVYAGSRQPAGKVLADIGRTFPLHREHIFNK